MKIEAVLFDMDGLIFDTERLHKVCWLETGKRLGYPMKEEHIDQIRGRISTSSCELFREWFGSQVDYYEARKLRTELLDEMLQKSGVPVKPGYTRLKAYLKEKGIRTALATSSQRKRAEGYFKMAKLPMDFDTEVCGTEIAKGKPDPDVFLRAAEKLHVAPENCLVLEDSPNGVRAGSAAGCQVIMVPDMDPATEELRKMCSMVAETLEDVIGWLEK